MAKKNAPLPVGKDVIQLYEDVGYRVLCFSSPNDKRQFISVVYPDRKCRRTILCEGARDLQLGWQWLVEQHGEIPPESQIQQISMF